MSGAPARGDNSPAPLSRGQLLFWRWWFWVAPVNLFVLGLDGHFGGPFFGDHTGAGRFERNPQALLLASLAALCAWYMSSGLLRHRLRRGLFILGCATAGFLDMWYVNSLFSGSMVLLLMAVSGLPGEAAEKSG